MTKLAFIYSATAYHQAFCNLFHICMQNVLGLISSYGKTDIKIKSSDKV